MLGWETLLTISGPSCSIENLNGSGVTAIVSQSYLEQTISDCRIAHIQSVYTDQAAVVLESYGSDNQTSFIPVMTVRGLTIDDIGQAGIYVASMWTAVRVERNLIRGWSHRGIEFDGFSTASTMVAENNLVVGHQDPLDLSGIAIAGGNVWVWFNTVDCAPLSVDGVPADVGIQTSDAELTTAIVATWWSTVRPPGSGG